MPERLRQWAPYVSMFGLAVMASAVVLRGMEGLAPNLDSRVLPSVAILGAILMAAWPLARPGDVVALLSTRRARYGGNAAILAVSVLGILGVVNYLGTRWYYSWDLTENRQYSLSRQTLQILDDVAEPVRVTSLLSVQTDLRTIEDLRQLVERYRRESPNFEYRNIDPATEPMEARAFADALGRDIRTIGRSLVAQSGTRHAVVYSFDEQGVSEAIVKATRSRDLHVWFTTGHGEMTSESGMRLLAGALGQEGYTVGTRNLLAMTETLGVDTVQLVVVAGPTQPFRPEEVDLLQGYMNGGGSLMLLLDPPRGEGTDPGLGRLLAPWGILPRPDVILNPGGPLSPEVLIIGGDGIQFHTITRDLMDLNSTAIIPIARSLAVGESFTSTLTATPLLMTGPTAWGETNLAEEPAAPGPEDTRGPLTVAVAAEGDEGMGRMVVVGGSIWAGDQFFQETQGLFASLNGNLFLNAVNWLTQEEALISIRPTPPDSRPLQTPGRPGLLLLATTIVLPLAVLALGTWIWWRRR